MIEFIIILPLLLCIAGATIEIARFLRFNQMASVLSQEAALRAYRQCSDFFLYANNEASDFDPEATRALTGTCLDGVRTQLANARTSLIGSTQSIAFNISISVYRHDGTQGADGFTGEGDSGSNPVRIASSDSEFSGTDRAANQFRTLPQVRGRMVIAEVSYNYTPVIQLYQGFWGGLAAVLRKEGNVFKETTII
jgi:Flp pilus assembly protein TadG